MEISGTWGTEIEVIALATLLKTTIALYTILLVQKYLFGITIPMCSDTDTSICIYLHNTGNHFNRVKTVTSGV